jgi:xylulokinase
MTGPMVAWLARNRPEVVARTTAVLHAKDVVRLALTDRPTEPRLSTDRSDASATLLWDVAADGWAHDVVSGLGVPARLLPPVVPSYQEAGRTDWLARLVPGATEDVAVAAGAGDTPAAMLAVDASGVHVNFGTGAQVLLRLPHPANPDADPSTHLYADAADGWYAMAALQNAGLALDHAAGLLALSRPDLFAAAVRGRAGKVSFLPFLTGERGGVASPSSRGGWLGIGIETTRDDLARAAVEGVLFAIRRSTELLGPGTGAAEPVVTLSGGGWRAPLLVQLIADLLDRPTRRVRLRSASAVGAAMVAARCVGAELPVERSIDPPSEPRENPELHDAYRRWLERCSAAETPA